MTEAVIVAGARTPIGRANKGSLVDVDAFELAKVAVGAAIDRSGIPTTDLDDIVVLITSGVGIVDAEPLVALFPVLACTASLLEYDRTVVLAAAVSSSESRAPPTS